MDRGDWWATVHRVTKSQTQLKWLSTHTSLYLLPHLTSHPSETNEKLQAALTGVPPDQLLSPPFPLPDLQQFPIQKEEQMTISVLSDSVLSYDSQGCSGLTSKMLLPQSLVPGLFLRRLSPQISQKTNLYLLFDLFISFFRFNALYLVKSCEGSEILCSL